MNEKILDRKKNGMAMLLLFLLLYLAAVGLVIFCATGLKHGATPLRVIPMCVGILWLLIGFIPFCGLKVLKPQEALVLTLFGKYIGTL